MTKKDYIKIATIMKQAKKDALTHEDETIAWTEHYEIDRVVDKLADIFEQDNPNFNRKRFIEACLTDSR